MGTHHPHGNQELNRPQYIQFGEQPRKNELIIPVKLVLKAKQTATGKLEKLKARNVARGDLEKQMLKKTNAAYQQYLQDKMQQNAENDSETS